MRFVWKIVPVDRLIGETYQSDVPDVRSRQTSPDGARAERCQHAEVKRTSPCATNGA